MIKPFPELCHASLNSDPDQWCAVQWFLFTIRTASRTKQIFGQTFVYKWVFWALHWCTKFAGCYTIWLKWLPFILFTCKWLRLNSLTRDKLADIIKTTFWNAISSIASCVSMPLPLGAGVIMLSDCPSVRPSIRPFNRTILTWMTD